MKLKIYIIIILLISNLSFAQDKIQNDYISKKYNEKIKKYNVFFENNKNVISQNIIEKNSIIMIDIEKISNLLNIKYNFYKNKNILTFFYKNNFIKMKINDYSAYVNGKHYKLDEFPFIENNVIFIPLEFLVKNLDFNIFSNITDITISKRDNKRFYLIDNIFYKIDEIDEYNLKLLIPLNWKKITYNSFEVNSDYSFKKITITRENTNLTLQNFAENYRKNINNNFFNNNETKTNINEMDKKNYITKIDSDFIDNKKIFHFEYLIKDEKNTNGTIYNLFFFQIENSIFKIELQYNFKNNNINTNNEIFQIIKYINLNQSIITFDEYYYETSNAIENDFKLNNEIISNMQIFGKFNINGSIKNYDEIFIKIEKNNKNIIYNTKIINNLFNLNAYTPFGTGKYNINIFAKNNNTNIDLVKFSVINTSSKYNIFNVPTNFINSDHEDIVSLANIIMKNSKNDLQRINAVYNYILNNIELIDNKINTENSVNITKLNKANPLEINILFNALLRAKGFNSIIYSTKNNNEIHYFSEVKLNEKWYIFDLVNEIYRKNNQSIKFTKLNKFHSFFRLNPNSYKSLLDNYQIIY